MHISPFRNCARVLSCAMLVTTIGLAGARAEEEVSYSFTSPADYAVLDGDLYSLPDLKLIQKGFDRTRAIQPVAGRAELIAKGDINAERGVVASAITLQPPGARSKDPGVVRFPAWDWEKDLKITPLLSQDLRRMVWAEQGDIYRATFDWQTGEIADKQQVTQLGVFRYMPEYLWSGNTLYLNAGFDEAKPVVRVDLLSGDISEHSAQFVFEGKWEHHLIANPAGTHVVRFDQPMIWAMDLRTGSLIPSSLEYEQESVHGNTVIKTGTMRDRDVAPAWVDDRHLFFADPIAGEAAVLDVQNGAVTWLSKSSAPMKTLAVLPGNQYADAAEMPAPEPNDTRRRRDIKPTARVIVNLKSGERTPMDVPLDAEITWLSERFGVYQLTDGGLSTVGLWAFDREKGKAVRLTPMPVQMHTLALSEKHDLLLFSVHRKGAYAVSLGGGEAKRIDDDGTWWLFREPVKLGLREGSSDPWEAAAEKAGPMDAAGSLADADDLIGVRALWAAIQSKPPALREEALATYKQSGGSVYYDRVALTLLFVKAREQNPDMHKANLLNSFDWRPALSPVKIKEHAEQNIYTTSHAQLLSGRVTEAQLAAKADWIGDYVASHLKAEHPETGAIKSSKVQQVGVSARRAYDERGTSGDAGDAAQEPQPEEQAAEESEVSKEVKKEVKKEGKRQLDRAFEGLFGR